MIRDDAEFFADVFRSFIEGDDESVQHGLDLISDQEFYPLAQALSNFKKRLTAEVEARDEARANGNG